MSRYQYYQFAYTASRQLTRKEEYGLGLVAQPGDADRELLLLAEKLCANLYSRASETGYRTKYGGYDRRSGLFYAASVQSRKDSPDARSNQYVHLLIPRPQNGRQPGMEALLAVTGQMLEDLPPGADTPDAAADEAAAPRDLCALLRRVGLERRLPELVCRILSVIYGEARSMDLSVEAENVEQFEQRARELLYLICRIVPEGLWNRIEYSFRNSAGGGGGNGFRFWLKTGRGTGVQILDKEYDAFLGPVTEEIGRILRENGDLKGFYRVIHAEQAERLEDLAWEDVLRRVRNGEDLREVLQVLPMKKLFYRAVESEAYDGLLSAAWDWWSGQASGDAERCELLKEAIRYLYRKEVLNRPIPAEAYPKFLQELSGLADEGRKQELLSDMQQNYPVLYEKIYGREPKRQEKIPTAGPQVQETGPEGPQPFPAGKSPGKKADRTDDGGDKVADRAASADAEEIAGLLKLLHKRQLQMLGMSAAELLALFVFGQIGGIAGILMIMLALGSGLYQDRRRERRKRRERTD